MEEFAEHHEIAEFSMEAMVVAVFVFILMLVVFFIAFHEIKKSRITSKKALIYGVTVIAMGVIPSSLDLLNDYLAESGKALPYWILYLFSLTSISVIAYFVWRKVSESELLKYEFVTIITHKLRTPLTRIKWDCQEIINSPDPGAKQIGKSINSATVDVISLINSLVTLSESEGSFVYRSTVFSIIQLTEEILKEFGRDFESRHITLHFNKVGEGIVKADKEKIAFVIQNVVRNSLIYTPSGGIVTVSAEIDNAQIHLKFSDTGIGIAKNDLPRVMTKFFRTQKAKTTDTEGTGIGLYISSMIMKRSQGSISVTSHGENLGSTFLLTLPLYANN